MTTANRFQTTDSTKLGADHSQRAAEILRVIKQPQLPSHLLLGQAAQMIDYSGRQL